ncbi:hypothetical protein F5X96DRAFT_361138 [Biscogniauxia mediterranea]|nr:hypothetical protein F5X96DRAFT_361138 [Biscogniauxia mediterranea]
MSHITAVVIFFLLSGLIVDSPLLLLLLLPLDTKYQYHHRPPLAILWLMPYLPTYLYTMDLVWAYPTGRNWTGLDYIMFMYIRRGSECVGGKMSGR